jgi:hypothetical protein
VSADFATTRMPIKIFFVAYRGSMFANGSCSEDAQYLVWQCSRTRFFYCELPDTNGIAYSGTIIPPNWQLTVIWEQVLAVRSETVPNFPQWKPTFFVGILQKYMYDRLKSILVILMVPDHFGQIRILKRTLAVRGTNFQSRCQIGIREVYQNPLNLRTLIYIYG